MTSPFFEEPYQARRSYRKSCDRCHASKLKCVSLSPADPFSECIRCNKARLLCSYSPRSAKPTSARASDAFGDRLQDCNEIVISATTSDAFFGGRSPLHDGNRSGTGAGHFTRLRSSSSAAPAIASDAVHVLPLPDGHSGSSGAFDQWLDWHPSPGDFTAMSASSLELDHDPFAEFFASMPPQTPASQDADSLQGLTTQRHTSSGELFGLSTASEEMRLLEHTGRLSKMYAGLRDGSWCSVPQSMQDLSKCECLLFQSARRSVALILAISRSNRTILAGDRRLPGHSSFDQKSQVRAQIGNRRLRIEQKLRRHGKPAHEHFVTVGTLLRAHGQHCRPPILRPKQFCQSSQSEPMARPAVGEPFQPVDPRKISLVLAVRGALDEKPPRQGICCGQEMRRVARLRRARA
jgi:hypothetical protein